MNANLNMEEIYVLKITLEKRMFFKKELASKPHKLSHVGFIFKNSHLPYPHKK